MSNSTSTLKSFAERGCVGPTIKTRSGIYFNLLNPSPDDVRIEDIAWALAHTCRFGGHCCKFYSVAEHSWLAAQTASRYGHGPNAQLAILMHDAAEAYAGDVVKPLKNLIGVLFAEIESRIEQAIGTRFGIDFDAHREVIHQFDFGMLIQEKYALFDISADEPIWAGEEHAIHAKVPIEGLYPRKAYYRFQGHFQAIMDQVGLERAE